KLRFGAVFVYRVLKGKILRQKKARQLRRETSSYGRTMNNEIAGLSSPSIPILTIRLFTQPGINNLICVGGTALRCKGGKQ
ncbi:hypothetical protein N5Q78_20550, partial [Escherichia coli]|nr:hypothetical protein [Escherichia coli]